VDAIVTFSQDAIALASSVHAIVALSNDAITAYAKAKHAKSS
jgi:hypothetical protein